MPLAELIYASYFYDPCYSNCEFRLKLFWFARAADAYEIDSFGFMLTLLVILYERLRPRVLVRRVKLLSS